MGENILQGYPYSRVTRQPQEPGLYPAPTGLEDRGGAKSGAVPHFSVCKAYGLFSVTCPKPRRGARC
jgi:hypothetical protein